jgi:YebC/PmpR family DNA-binding regulatory protein
MAGHSKFANIKHRKGAQDKKRAKLFTKLLREITVAAKTGHADADFNPRLRSAIIEARGNNVPKDKIDAAIKKATSDAEGENFEEIRYEGYAPGGIAIIVEALTDNRNRTASEVRSAFSKAGGALGETGSVNFMFDHIGMIQFSKEVASEEEMFEASLEAGADEVFSEVRDNLIAKYGDPKTAKLAWRPNTPSEISDLEQAQKLIKMIDSLEDLDDVQTVTGGFDLTDSVVEKLEF